jgi:hypothetical protein
MSTWRTILLTEKEADVVVRLMRRCFEEYVAKYNKRKYPPGIYQDLLKSFCLVSQVSPGDIRTAILWKFGHLGKKRIPSHHEQLILCLQRQWPALSPTLNGPIVEVFTNLKKALGGRDPFITTAFLAHLLRPREVPIIDQHNFRAMNHYCAAVRAGWRLTSKPRTYEDVAMLSSFLSDVKSRWAAADQATVPDERRLDLFLMMYGKALKVHKPPPARVSTKARPHGPQTRSPSDPGTRIRLPFGGSERCFDANALVRQVIGSGSNHILQGQINCGLSAHRKPRSLDVWLRRNFAANPDIKQAVNEVVNQLVATGLFEEGTFLCPDSGRMCKGIRLVSNIKHDRLIVSEPI